MFSRLIVLACLVVSPAIAAGDESDLKKLHHDAMTRLTNADPADDAEGFAMLVRAADGGLAVAQYDVAICYERGIGVTQDFAQEVIWLERAATQGNVDAEYKLAHSYRTGRGTAIDPGKAFAWYLKAAQHGDGEARNNVATCYRDGFGVAQDLSQAQNWYERAAAAGDTEAKANLVRMLADHGKWDEADLWLVIVTQRRAEYSPAAQHDMDGLRVQIEGHLTPTQKQRAADSAHEWLAAHPAH